MATQEEQLLLKITLQADPKTAKTQADLEKAQKRLRKAIKEAPKEGTEEYKKLEATIKKAKRQLRIYLLMSLQMQPC